MSELIDAKETSKAMRRHLLATVSALALATSILKAGDAKADSDDSDRPVFWIELGGQLERQTSQGDVYDPPGIANYPNSPAYKPSPLQFEKPPPFSNGAEASLSFQPKDSDWLFSATVRYGRANGSKVRYHNTPGQELTRVSKYRTFPPSKPYGTLRCCHTTHYVNRNPDYIGLRATHRASHAILDFQAGKDVGLGMFGRSGESVLSGGVRIAQFSASSTVAMHGKPDEQFYNSLTSSFLQQYPQKYIPTDKFHVFAASAESERSFHGIGPSLSWNASAALLGNAQVGALTFDWGVNAAILFGRRTAKGEHHESGHYHKPKYHSAGGNYEPNINYYTNPPQKFDRRHTVAVPNVGGFAGVSFKFPNAKVSLGYRGDFFLGAMDTGWDTEKNKTVGFYGPFASISIGIGG